MVGESSPAIKDLYALRSYLTFKAKLSIQETSNIYRMILAMALKFRLKGLAETMIDDVECPCCGVNGGDDENFSNELTRVTYEGIIVVLQCRHCNEIFVPENQRLGIINVHALKEAVKKDSADTGEPLYQDIGSVVLNAEKLNAIRRGAVH